MKNTHITGTGTMAITRSALLTALGNLYGEFHVEQAGLTRHQLDLVLIAQSESDNWTDLAPLGLTASEALKHLVSGTAAQDGPTAAQVADIANREVARLLGPRPTPAPMTTRTYSAFGMITEEEGSTERVPSIPEERLLERTHHVRYDSRAEVFGENRKVLTVTSAETIVRAQVNGGTHDVTRTDSFTLDQTGEMIGSVDRGHYAEQLVLRDNDPAFRSQIQRTMNALFSADLNADTATQTLALMVSFKLSFSKALEDVRNPLAF